MEEKEIKAFFGRELLAWYREIKRDLPWRINRDPYRVWVSEIMLQQTRVDTVIPFYNAFMSRFPTVKALAEAPEEEVLKRWEGLGYYSRARNLQAGAREVMERYGGIVPDDKASVAGLKGVGPYTTGAIMSIAFNRPEPAVDGNVMRVLSRFFCLEEDIAKPATRVGIEKLAASLIPEGAAGDFNQGLMELGALVCTPKSPGCLTCPVMEHCAGRLAGREHELPVKTKAKPPRPEYRAAVVVTGMAGNAGKILVRQRPDTGLLAQMWELPHLLLPNDMSGIFDAKSPKEQGELAAMLGQMLEAETGLLIRPRSWLMDADHVFSHIHWHMRVYEADLGEEAGLSEAAAAAEESLVAAEAAEGYAAGSGAAAGYRWIGKEDMETLPFPNLFIRILKEYWK
ncbi:A/G-specific adenine glycosylase [Paenibacillus sp. N4]|uniref:A/G-specific adenine glycosylase n=1 Tax=Paenibacillus vietnamensis TaxID=2590547 RepID=UPI001CD0B922|nr:A/G-specific adenine glycosylase [Paenibacillus vietnamensis]MCA0755857.1 A/G-specific adenine glycosylase [Paenibacillus vietnamensis]